MFVLKTPLNKRKETMWKENIFFRISKSLKGFSVSKALAELIDVDYVLIEFETETKTIKFVPCEDCINGFKITKSTNGNYFIGATSLVKNIVKNNPDLVGKRFFIDNVKNIEGKLI